MASEAFAVSCAGTRRASTTSMTSARKLDRKFMDRVLLVTPDIGRPNGYFGADASNTLRASEMSATLRYAYLRTYAGGSAARNAPVSLEDVLTCRWRDPPRPTAPGPTAVHGYRTR